MVALTKEDLQAIATLLQPIHGQLDGLESSVTDVKTDVERMGAGVSEVKADVAQLGADVSEVNRKLFEVEIR
ncbi:MAG: hypothetical protein K2G28_03825, partial [Acetatifactor sp.]|nr:hypothetical protein [Acetatifactor sp.]